MAREFSHLDYTQRYEIKEMLDQGVSKAQIAVKMNVDPSSIYREIKRGMRNGVYDPEYANQKYRRNLSEKGPTAKLEENKELADYISDMILNHAMSPERIVEQLKRDSRFDGWNISIPTIYLSIDKGRIPGVTRETLRKQYVTVFNDGQICIPQWALEQLEIKNKDQLHIDVTDDGKIVFQKIKNKT